VVISGHIVSVQEQRFRVQTETGQVYLLTLGRGARVDEAGLAELQRQRALVTVAYTGEPNLASGVAQDVRRASA
jgi:hypothetical protein